jgi:phosphoribosylformimino-5-aminoimidazole carboxamide ribotide isomerase
MELIPAIDLLDGNVVRLHKGDYNAVTVYSNDPVAQAKAFYDAGARRLHIVDLEAARSGKPHHVKVIESILSTVPLAVQVGGGIRSAEAASVWLAAGISRVVIGTLAVEQPDIVQGLCERYPDGIIAAVDARDGEVSVHGWTKGSGMRAIDLAKRVDSWGAAAILFTAIERDGTSEGPDVPATIALQREVKATVIASGGIGSLAHLRALVAAGARSAVCGRALYSGAFTLPEAFEASDHKTIS